MIRAIVGTSLKFRGLVLGIAAAIIVIGALTLRDASSDVLPEFTPPYVEIQTESLGLSADEVEQLITVPLEADLLNGVEGVDVIRSSSTPGLSSVVLVFEPGFDVYKGRQLVQERLTQLGGAAFPNISKPPAMLQPLSSSSRVMMIGLSSKDLSLIDKSVIARWTVRPRLMGVEGVANVSIWGMRDQQIQVQVDPERLRDKNVTLQQVIRTAGNAQIASPVSYIEASVPGTGGFIETPQQRLPIRNVFDNIATPSQLGRVPVEGTGGKLRLTDVSNVVEDHQPLIGDAVVGDGEGLLLVVEKFPGASTKEVTDRVEAELEALKPGLAGMDVDTSVFRPASYIDDAIDNLTLTLIIGAALLVLAMVAFLRAWRTVLAALVTVPVAMVAAALVLSALGETFNAISFAGLVVALVVVIDDAVHGAHNVARRLRDRGEASVADTVLQATHEVRRPLAYGTIAGLLVVVPLAVMEGRPGAFLGSLALAYTLATLAAMVTALTLTPALALLLPSKPAESGLLRRIGAWYGSLLPRVLGRPGPVLGVAGAATLLAVIALPTSDTSVIPSLKDRDVLVRMDAPPGTSQPRMTELATNLSKELRGIDGVENVGGAVGRAVTGDRIVDVNSGEMVVSLDSDADYDDTMAAIKDAAAGVEGARTEVLSYSTSRVRDIGGLDEGVNPVKGDGLDVLTGTDRPIVARLFGQNLDVLKEQAPRIEQIVAGVDGIKNPKIESFVEQPTLEIEVDIEKARNYGIKPGDVRRAEAIMLQGILVGSVFDDQKVFDVMVQGTPDLATSQAKLRNLLIDRPGGGHVRLAQIADIREGRTPTVIKRDSVSRKIDITAEVEGRSVEAVADDLEEALADVKLPLEYHVDVLDPTVADEINSGQILAFGVAAGIALLLLLQAALRSWRLAAFAFLALPAAVAGGVVVMLVQGDGLTVAAIGGLLALLALAARSSVTTLLHFQDLERHEGEPFGLRLVVRGATERLTPVVTSAAGVAVALAPFAVMGTPAGLEVVQPMAVVVLGGLATTTAVALFVLPALYLRVRAAQGDRPLAADDELATAAA
ncbi:MAG TPA: efflux RND transporter permease subunit [Baekduia sp.]|nr:efflux RND transporter permease subunit [Baekduia sp.]